MPAEREVAALRYTPGTDEAPLLLAAGRGYVAEKILAKAEESGIPVVEDADLAHTLTQLAVGQEIPAELYELVAQVLLFVSNMDSAYAARLGIAGTSVKR